MTSIVHPKSLTRPLFFTMLCLSVAQPSLAGADHRAAQADKPGPMQSNSGSAASASPPAAGPAKGAADFDVEKLFANTCGWCHSKGGREQGKGPKLMDNPISDADIVFRVKNGKIGYMPAFGGQFNDDQLKAIVAYIRNLKP